MELTARKKQILKAVIDYYIANGAACGSGQISDMIKPKVSPATVRNELFELEEMGLLEHLHTSAGRTPTARGYRIYVDFLMEAHRPSFRETLLMNSMLSDNTRDPEKLMDDMTGLLAEMTGYTVVSLCRETTGTVEKFEGVFVNRESFLLVMITSAGRAITKQFRTRFPIDAEGVAFIIGVLNDHLAKKELGGVTMERMIALEDALGEYRVIMGQLLKVIYDVMSDLGKYTVSASGVTNLFDYPEFSPDKIKELIGFIENREELTAKFTSDLSGEVRVHIGNSGTGIDGASFVSCPFVFGKKLCGVCCIIGPKRMDYAKVMARLSYISGQIQAVHGFEPTLPMIETKEK